MQTESDILFIDDGRESSFTRSVLARPGVVCLAAAPPAEPLAALPDRPRCVLLQVAGETRAQWLREILRRKWPLACAWPEINADGTTDDDPRWLDQLAAATRTRRLPACVLGAWRVIPALASLKELISGGCLGDIQHLNWNWLDESQPSRRYQWLAANVLRWLADDTGVRTGPYGQSGERRSLSVDGPGTHHVLFSRSDDCGRSGLAAAPLTKTCPAAMHEALCSVVGHAGQAVARIRLPDGAGWVESVLGTRRRRRDFTAVHNLDLELTLLWRFAGKELKTWPALAMLNEDSVPGDTTSFKAEEGMAPL